MPLARTFFDFTVGDQPLGRVVVSQIRTFHCQATLISSSNYTQMCKSFMTSRVKSHIANQQSPKDSRKVSLPSLHFVTEADYQLPSPMYG